MGKQPESGGLRREGRWSGRQPGRFLAEQNRKWKIGAKGGQPSRVKKQRGSQPGQIKIGWKKLQQPGPEWVKERGKKSWKGANEQKFQRLFATAEKRKTVGIEIVKERPLQFQ